MIIGTSIMGLNELSFISPVVGTNLLNYALCISLMIGILMFTLTPVGLYSVLLNQPTVMVAFMCLTFFISCLGGTTAIFGFRLRLYLSDNTVKSWMMDSLMHEYGNPSGLHVMRAWDKMQAQMNCCGVKRSTNATDWVKSDWFKKQTNYPPERVPRSCCPSCYFIHEKFCNAFITKPPKNGAEFKMEHKICLNASSTCEAADEDILVNVKMCVGHTFPPSRWPSDAYLLTTGCYSPLARRLWLYSTRLLVLGSGCLVFHLLATILWFVIHELAADPLSGYAALIARRR
ncbi:hypothetical protein WR25_03194 isoform A [Diploscapter pachys]|uniref:Tetraspanin n=1 Tax=Diploscapter pachys TaxID=2018661 RepID=A0A2A2KYW4_9BILA|nr:hypothetical protein WR25_03194 isoform A [Diploscapter pachys]